jgi:hypothetical protein
MSDTTDEKKVVDAVKLNEIGKGTDLGDVEDLIEVVLPSNGIPYGWDDGKVMLRVMTTKEEKLFATASGLTKSTHIITKLIQACVDTRKLDPRDLIIGDRVYLLFMLRSCTYTHRYDIPVTCESELCRKKFVTTLDIENLETRQLKEGPTFTVELPEKKDTVELRLLTGRDEEAIIDFQRKQQRYAEKLKLHYDDIDNTYEFRLALSIASINGESVDQKAKMKYVSSMKGKDSLIIRNTLDEYEPGIELLLNIECVYCGYENEVVMPMTSEFFRPRRL